MNTQTDPITSSDTDDRAETAAASPDSEAWPEAQPRLMLAVRDLVAHPGNVRPDMSLGEEFCASIAAEGVRIPLLVTPAGNGGWLVIEGHRRLSAAAKVGLAEVPCDVDSGRATDAAGQYLDMLLANSDAYRANYTVTEEAAALFAAHEAGASRTRIRKATGRTAARVKTALAAGSLPAETTARAAEASADLTLDDLAILAEFASDEGATGRLLTALELGYPVEHVAEQLRREKAEAAEHARIRADLGASGVTVTDRLPDGAAWLTSLTHDGADLAPETHVACPGNGATFSAWNLLEPAWYCTDPIGSGHASRWHLGGSSTGAASIGDGAGSAGPSGQATTDATTGDQTGSGADTVMDPSRRLVIAGNRAWQASARVRHRWLAGSLFNRKTAPREASEFLARQLLTMPAPLRAGLANAAAMTLFTELTGHDARQWQEACSTASAGRLVIVMLAPVVTAFEHAMTDAEKRAELRLIQHSARGDIGISAGQEGCRFLWPERDRWSACASCARSLLTQQCCI